MSAGDMDFVDGSTYVDTALSPDIWLDFTASDMTSDGSDTFKAVVFAGILEDNKVKCDYDHILGYTPGADLTVPDGSLGAVFQGAPGIFGVTVVEPTPQTNPPKYTVKIDTDFDFNPLPPGYSEFEAGSPLESVGQLLMCVELQQFGCDNEKDEFATVGVQIDYDLDATCLECNLAKVKKENLEQDSEGVAAPQIDCVLSNPIGDPAEPFTQGQVIKVCINYKEPDSFDDACFDQVLELKAKIYDANDDDWTGEELVSLNELPQSGWDLATGGNTCGQNAADISINSQRSK